jgi:uncharacterized membrane protein
MNGLASALQLATAACLGVYAGAMLTEGLVLVPFWQSLAPPDFLAWYAANDARLLAFFSPLTIAVALVTLLSTAAAMLAAQESRWLTFVAMVITHLAVASYFVYFEAANASFSAATIAPEAVPAELVRWATWHHARTLLSLVAFACTLLCIRRDAAALGHGS